MSNKEADNSFDNDDSDFPSKYQPPKDVPISEIMQKDQDDQSLNEYKKKLLGGKQAQAIKQPIQKYIPLFQLSNLPSLVWELSRSLKAVDRHQIKRQL